MRKPPPQAHGADPAAPPRVLVYSITHFLPCQALFAKFFRFSTVMQMNIYSRARQEFQYPLILGVNLWRPV